MIINFKQLLLTFVLLLFMNTSYSKDPEVQKSIQSLKKELLRSIKDKKRVDLLNKLSRLEECQDALKYARDAEKLAFRIKYSEGLTNTYASLVAVYRDCGDYEQSVYYSNRYFERLKSTQKKHDETFVYVNLGDLYFAKGDTTKSIKYLKKSLLLSKKLGNLMLQVQAIDLLALIAFKEAKFPTAEKYYKASLSLYKKLNRKSKTAWAAGNVALMNFWVGEYREALNYGIFSLNQYEEVKNDEGITWMSSLIGLIYKNIEDYDKSLEYLNKAFEIQKKANDFAEMANTYILLSRVYFDMKNMSKSHDFVDKADRLYNRLNIQSGLREVVYQRGINYFEEAKFDLSEFYLNKEFDLAVKINDLKSIAHCKRLIGAINVEKGKVDEGRLMLKESLILFQKLELQSHYPFVYKYLTKADSLIGDFESAFEHYKNYVHYKNLGKNDQEDTEKIAARYEFEKKEALVKAELKTKNLQRNGAIVGLIFMIIVVVIVVFLFQLRSKKMKVEKENVELSKREAHRIIEAEQFKSRFLVNISHEFRTPLTLINGHLEVMEENGREEDKSRLNEMKNNSKQLLQLINQLLELSKMESATYKLKYQSGNVLENTKVLVESFQSLAEQKNIQFRFNDHSMQSEEFVYSEHALSIILSNLLSNALKYTPDGGIVFVDVDLQKGVFSLKVTDTGIGIKPEHLPHVFDRFYQVDEPSQRTYEGSGIGLALVKELALLHGGDVVVETREEGGCIFTVVLNSYAGELVSEEVDQEEVNVFVKDIGSTSKNLMESELPLILVVEDQLKLRRFIVENLGEKYRYAEAKDGAEGIKLAGELLPDLIICDIMMPDIDGLTLCKKLKGEIETCHIPIVLLTAKADQRDKLAGLEVGADDYLTKPFSLAELKLRVRNIMRAKELFRKKFEGNSFPKPKELTEISPKDREFIEQLEEVIFSNLSERQFGAQELSEQVFISISKLNRKLKSLTGKTPAEYIRDLRFQKAVSLLKDGENVAEAGWEVGFEDPVYFSKAFKKQFGYAPSTVKKVAR
jgi:signal transduction histidine kinase/CheY-like chemotaxis protein/AraC-like DNA-binding protein